MSEQQLTIVENLQQLEKPFSAQNAYALKFESECLFAKQQITKSDFAMNTAKNNVQSLRSAILNVAAIGISLNPATAHAYLVPRDKAICLDVSYRGLVKLATDSGAIEWAKAVLVYEGDEFKWRGPAEMPIHEADPFDTDRMNAADPLQKLKGGYCVAKLADGTYMTDVMSAAEILEVRNSSKAFTSGKSCPWKGKWAGEMAKKTLVKRASKSWPQSNGRTRLDHAIEVINEHEGFREEETVVRPSDFVRPTEDQTQQYLDLAKNGSSVEFYAWFYEQDEKVRPSLPGCEFEKGTKMKTMARFNEKLKDGQKTLEVWSTDLQALCESGDEDGVAEFMGDLTTVEARAVTDKLSPEHSMFVQRIAEAA